MTFPKPLGMELVTLALVGDGLAMELDSLEVGLVTTVLPDLVFSVHYFCIVIIFLAPRVTGVDVDGDGIADFNVVNRPAFGTNLVRSGVWGGYPRVTGVDVDGDGIADFNVVNRSPYATNFYRPGAWGW